jgi:glycosyltransferase involved in cell wall biosynthesis
MFNLATDADDPLLGFGMGWIRALAGRVDALEVITMRAGRLAIPGNVRVHSLGKERGHTEVRRLVEFYRALARVLGEGPIDACFSHMNPLFTVLGAPFLKVRGVPIVTWYAHRHVTRTVKVAHWLSDYVTASVASGYRYRRDKLVVLGQGIDTEQFHPLGEPPEPGLLTSVGRISPIKDLLTLVDAVAVLRERGRQVRCVLVGEAPPGHREYALAVRERVRSLGLGGSIELVGSVPNETVAQWHRRALAHVNLCPSGAIDKAALEAMACGRPSLVANDAFAETLGAWKRQLLFRHGDPIDLADKVEALMTSDSAEIARMGRELRARVVELHSLDQLVDRLLALFDRSRPGAGVSLP